MFDKPYRFDYLGSKKTMMPNPVEKALYRFAAEKRKYLVTIEVFSFGVVAVKFCGLKDQNAANRFDKIYNDKDGFRVIGTCLHVMHDYWRRHPNVNFAFYAIPRKFDEKILENKKLSPSRAKKFIERFKKVRFAIYDYGMVNLFPPTAFILLRDAKNGLYLLMNKKQQNPKAVVQLFGKFLLENYEMIFDSANE